MRSYSRFNTDHEISYVAEGQQRSAQLYNLSSGGCMIEAAAMTLAVGHDVEVRLRGQTVLPGVVAWCMDRNAGIKFTVPLHHRVVESFGYQTDGDDFDRYDPRDRFGIPLLGDAGDQRLIHVSETYTQIIPAGNKGEESRPPQGREADEVDPARADRAARHG